MALGSLCLGCGDEPEAEDEFQTETVKGQELVSCWTTPTPANPGLTDTVCRLVTDGPLVVNEARLVVKSSSLTSGFTLTPESPERVVNSSSGSSGLKIEMDLGIDASAVSGLGELDHHANLTFEKSSDHPADAPAIVTAPFATWRVAILGEDASFADATLEPYTIELAGREVSIKPELPDVALGDEAVVYLPVQTKKAIKGSARFVTEDSDEKLSFSIEGTGSYLVHKDGLEQRWAPAGELPAALSCWVNDDSALACQPQSPGGMFVNMAVVVVTLADGSSHSYSAVMDSSGGTTDLVDDVSVRTLSGLTPELELVKLAPESFPVTIDATVYVIGDAHADRNKRNGAVVGLTGDDPLYESPLTARIELESASEASVDAPVSVTLPFQVWRVTFEAVPDVKYVPELDGYDIHLATAWNGSEAGDEISLDGQLPYVTTSPSGPVLTQTFFLPVEPGRTEPIEGKLDFSDGLRFAIPGPGRYLMTADGLSAAPNP
ncbi:MAG: hypothetical protein HOV80_35335 [Polyangiaceae bacterium]|nr:hypothetical protein [Polyangiaceae bacterium]